MPLSEKEIEDRIQKNTINMLNDVVAEHTVTLQNLDAALKKAVVEGSKAAAEAILADPVLMEKYWSGAFFQFGQKATSLGKDTLWALLWGGAKKLFLVFCLFLFIGSYFGWPLAVTILKTFFVKE